jgi:uncharacterized protein with FMN-binding domain
MKLFIKIVLSIILVFILITAGGLFYLSRGLNPGAKLVIKDTNSSSLKDGSYTGKYEEGRWTNEIKVTVKNGKIATLDVIKDVTFPKPEWTKELFHKVIEKQSVQVDVISGATVTSKAYLKSIENALNSSK